MGRKKKEKSDSKPEITDVLDIEDLQVILNHVQINKKSCNFILSKKDCMIAENIMQDSGIVFIKEPTESGIKYILMPQ